MIRSLAIIGAGTMGGGIAITTLKAKLPTVLIDSNPSALSDAEARIVRHFQREVERGRMRQTQMKAALDLLTTTTEIEPIAAVDLVIEAVFEDLEVKRDLMRRIEPHLSERTIVATNTSCLLVSDIAKAMREPKRLIGLHYFSPAERSPIVEVVSTSQTDPELHVEAIAFLRLTQKTPLPCKDSPGFALNRFFCTYCNEAAKLQEEGIATPAQIDVVARDTFEVPAGPFAVMNLTKPVIMLRAMQGLQKLGEGYEVAQSLQRLGEAGGQWSIDAGAAPLDAASHDMVVARLTHALCRPAEEAVTEQVATPQDIETGARLAFRMERQPFDFA